MAQDAPDPPPGEAHRVGGRAPPSAQLRRHEHAAQLLGRRVVHADAVDLAHPDRVRGAERGHGGQRASLLVRVGPRVRRGEGDEGERPTPRVQVDDDVRHGQEMALEEVGDLLGRGPVRPAWEAPVQVAAIDRRGAGPGAEGRIVHRGDDDHPPRHLRGGQEAGELEERDRPLVLVPVVPARQERRRALAPLHHGHRDHDRAPRGVVAAVRQPEAAVLDAVAVEVDRRHDRRGPEGIRSTHGPALSSWRRASGARSPTARRRCP